MKITSWIQTYTLEPIVSEIGYFLCEIQNLLVSKIGPRNTSGTPTKSLGPILKNDRLTHAGDFQKNGPFKLSKIVQNCPNVIQIVKYFQMVQFLSIFSSFDIWENIG